MNYGVLVLGATISISLFLRICGGSVSNTNIYYPKDTRIDIYDGAKDDSTVYGWVTGNKFYEFEELIHSIWQTNHGNSEFSIVPQANKFIDEIRPSYGSGNKRIISLQDYTPVLPVDDDDICDMDWRHEESHLFPHRPSEIRPLAVDRIQNPNGCHYAYNSEDKILLCQGKTVYDMHPNLPLFPWQNHLVEFHLVSTSVDDVPRFAFGNGTMTINNILLKNNKLKVIDPRTFAHVRNLTSLIIIHNELDFISREFFAGLTETKFLSLNDNLINFRKFENCSEKPIDEIPAILPSLNAFTLDGNPLEIIPKQMFAGMRLSPLTMLSLVNCRLTFIHPDAFSFLPGLENLNLSENPKVNFYEALQGLRNSSLKRLYLSTNNFLDVPKAALEIVASTLESLDLENNLLKEITSNSFPAMGKLKNLNLKSCDLDLIEDGSFDGMENLVDLVLSHNRLKVVPFAVSKLVKLNTLSLNNNLPSGGSFSIERGVFSKLSKLKNLYLNNLNLGYIQQDAFSGLTTLMYMLMDNAHIETIEDYAFSQLKFLKILSMRSSFTKDKAEFNSLTFYGLETLQTLYMDNNNISLFNPAKMPSSDLPVYSNDHYHHDPFKGNRTDAMIELQRDFASPFKYLEKLEWLYLSDNKIEDLFPEVFYGMEKLKFVLLDRNYIKSWRTQLFPNGTTVELLQLTDNKIVHITEEMQKDFEKVVGTDLTGNSISCKEGACQIRDLEKRRSKTFVSYDAYTCIDDNGYFHKISGTDFYSKFCDRELIIPPNEDPKEEFKSNIVITIGIVCFCGIFVMAAIVTGYKKRVHLKYFLFVVKFNVMKIPEKTISTAAQVLGYNFDIFISYHNDDTKFVKEFFLPEIENGPGASLNAQQEKYDHQKDYKPQLKVCFHERDFEVGVPITENILECVDRSKKVVVLVSKKYLESQWCVFEMKLAYHRLIESRRKSFLVVLMEDIPNELKTKVLNYLMKSRTYLEWPGFDSPPQQQRVFWNRLRASIKSSD